MTTIKTSEHPQYTKNKAKWQLVRDCVNDNVQANAIECDYIIKPPAMSDDDYKAYVGRAVFKNFTGQTLDVQKGAAFGKDFAFTGIDSSDLPESLEYMLTNADGSGTSLEDQIKQVGQDVFSVGRIGALVEYRAGGTGSMADSNRAKIVLYTAETIRDWDEVQSVEVDGKLVYVCLVESYSKLTDGARANQERKIELKLIDGLYTQVITDSGENATVKIIEPLDGAGKRMDFIPFKFFGADNNRPSASRVPMFKLSTINLALFRSDADLRTNLWLFAVPILSVSLDGHVAPNDFDRANGFVDDQGDRIGSIRTGGSKAYVGGVISYTQPSVDNILMNSQDRDEEALVKLGAQLISEGHNETAEAARIRKAAGTASLGDMVGNIESGYEDLFTWCMMMNNKGAAVDEFEFNMNRKFFDDRLDAQKLTAMLSGVMSGQIAKESLFKAMQRDGSMGVTEDDSYESYQAKIDEQPDNNLDLTE